MRHNVRLIIIIIIIIIIKMIIIMKIYVYNKIPGLRISDVYVYYIFKQSNIPESTKNSRWILSRLNN